MDDQEPYEHHSEPEPYVSWRNHIRDLSEALSIWRQDAKCRDLKEGEMIPPRAEQQEYIAKAICTNCPTAVECLYYSLVLKEEFGVWGGTTERDRKAIHKAIAKDQMGTYRVDFTEQHSAYLYSLAQYIVANPNERILESTQT